MAFTNLFRRHSCFNESQASNYACMDENSIAETLLDELETQCQISSRASPSNTKRNSAVLEFSGGFLPSAYNPPSFSKRRSSVDYSWLTPQNDPFQTQNELYHLPDILKMELSALIRNVLPEDCTQVVNQFRRGVRSQAKNQTPESIIAIFRKILADYIDQKQKRRSSSHEISKSTEVSVNLSSTTNPSLKRNNRVLPQHQSEDEQNSTAELTEISLSASQNEPKNAKPRSSTYT